MIESILTAAAAEAPRRPVMFESAPFGRSSPRRWARGWPRPCGRRPTSTDRCRSLAPVRFANGAGRTRGLLRSGSAPEAAVGLAAANALLGRRRGLSEEKALAVLRERGGGQKVAMIGRFPFAERLREHCGQLWVFERGLDRRQGDFGEEAMEQLLPQADVVAVTATTLLNRTLPAVLACVRPDAFLMMLGPTRPSRRRSSIRLRHPLRHRRRRPRGGPESRRAGRRHLPDHRRPEGEPVERRGT